LGRNAKGTHFFHGVKALGGTCCPSELNFEAPKEPFGEPIPQWAGCCEGSKVGSAHSARASEDWAGGSIASLRRGALFISKRRNAQVNPEAAREGDATHRVKARGTCAIESRSEHGLKISP